MAGPTDVRTDGCEAPVVGLDMGTFAVKAVLIGPDGVRRVKRPTAGQPLAAARACMTDLLGPDRPELLRLGLVGAHAGLLAAPGGKERPALEMEALILGLRYTGLQPEAVLSLGHENMYYFETRPDGTPTFFNRNGQCAAGSGAFWYQQATRMGLDDRGLAALALNSESVARISGRCAIFAKSDMTHAINEGATQGAVSAGLARTLAEMVISGVCQNRLASRAEAVVVGGVAGNEAIMKHLRECCPETRLVVPPGPEYLTALGACLGAAAAPLRRAALDEASADEYVPSNPLPSLDPGRVRYSPDLAPGASADLDTTLVFLGVDCGSVSTKCVLLDRRGQMIGGVYLPTAGRPALQVLELMHRAGADYGGLLADAEVVACTTGSGRFLSQKMLGAEYAVDEITCQAEGVKSLCGEDADLSVIEIGGEDGKFLQLRRGTLYDYNMNPVCAAGTGSFLENLAGLLGVDIKGEFSHLAFEAPYAIDLGDTCTLLSQSALASAASQGLPLPYQLASLAYSAARNYLRKTAENRPMEGQVVFTGATARNHALASAFAAELGRELIVPPSPELTGALGAALMALRLWRDGEKPEERFRGFGRLREFTRTQRRCSARCEHQHNCLLDVIQFPGGKGVIYGDRCGRYSGLGDKRRSRLEDLPDHVARRNELFFSTPSVTGGPRIGMARGGLFFDLYPFWAAFFSSLGAELVLSAQDSADALHQGRSQLTADLCYPAEVLVGHHKELLDRDLDFVFLPEVIDFKPLPWARDWPRAQTCPLLQTIRGAVISSLRPDPERLVCVEVCFWRGRRAVAHQLRVVAKRLLGERYTEARLTGAVEAAYRAFEDFQRAMEKEGQRVIEGLPGDLTPGAIAAVFIGRSYTLYDEDVSKRAMIHARQRGILAIPQDYLIAYVRGWYEGRIVSTLLGRKEDFDREFGQLLHHIDHIYPAQLQQMLSAAFIASYLNRRHDSLGCPRLHLILQDPFKCGPNAMLRHYLDLVSPYLRLTMDEHTAPAGMITRLEAFRNTCRGRDRYEAPVKLSSRTRSLATLGEREILVADASPHAAVIVALFKSYGIKASLLPRDLDEDHTLARAYVSGDECLPMIQNVQDFLAYLHGNGRGPGDAGDVAFFQAWSCGPCRYGLYAPTQALLLNRAGFGDQKVCSVKVEDLIRQLGLGFVAGMFDGVLAVDALQKMLLAARPYELESGSAQRAFDQSLSELCTLLSHTRPTTTGFLRGSHLGPFEDLLRRAARRFSRVERTGTTRPKIIVTGEFYVRLDDRCCQDVVGRIEAAGGEALLSPGAEFLHYTAYISGEEGLVEAAQTGRPGALLRGLMYGALSRLGQRDEARLMAAAGDILHEPAPAELRRLSRPYVPGLYAGELPMTIGRIKALAQRGEAHGVVAVAPFNCMRGLITECHLSTLREELGLPMVTLYYDGNRNPNREEFIRSLVFQAGAGG